MVSVSHGHKAFKLMRRHGSIVLLVATAAIALIGNSAVWGQRLDIPSGIEAWQPIELAGTVREVNKYSFVLETDDGDLRVVELDPRTRFRLVLDRPIVDLQTRTIRVHFDPADVDNPNARREYPLPEPAWLVVQFRTERQRDRVLKTEPARINNYRITPDQPRETGTLQQSGRLIVQEDRLVWQWNARQSYTVALGFQGAVMDGMNILNLEPDKTSVEISGRTDGDRIVAEQVRFRPILGDE